MNFDKLINEYRNRKMKNAAQNAAQNAYGAGIGSTPPGGLAYMNATDSLLAGTYLQQKVKVEKPALGVPLWRGAPVPDTWRGAEITDLALHHIDDYWRVTLQSKWSGDEITIYLSSDEYSGKQARKFGETIKDALNARRLG